ncbi:MAG: hypothetical protein D6755_12815 [Anaerolineae bacterium]|nr:MAG: hypothetical protein D6755_12815 [Anaerolineae bacterium]
MAELIALPVLGALVILQSALIRQVTVLQGSADIVMLMVAAWALQPNVRRSWVWAIVAGIMVGYISSVPLAVWLGGYVSVGLMAAYLRRRAWEAPILGMILLAIAGTLIVQGLAWGALRLLGTPLPLALSLRRVILPGILLNLLFAIPIYSLANDLATWVFPEALEI